MKKTLHFKKHKNCNLFCEGCISSTQNNNINSITETDNDSILQTMTLINQSTNPNEEIKYSISFLGGEPLLRKEDLTYYKNFITNNQEIISDYGIQTNLVFSDDILSQIRDIIQL
jgi:sulfatase maturation enzyme AslB (radical SAM superfamily)